MDFLTAALTILVFAFLCNVIFIQFFSLKFAIVRGADYASQAEKATGNYQIIFELLARMLFNLFLLVVNVDAIIIRALSVSSALHFLVLVLDYG